MNIPGRADTDEKKRAVLNRILAVWKRNPHLRLGQLILNKADRGMDTLDYLFYMEDEKIVELLEKT